MRRYGGWKGLTIVIGRGIEDGMENEHVEPESVPNQPAMDPGPDPKDAEISALKQEGARLTALVETLRAQRNDLAGQALGSERGAGDAKGKGF